MLQHPQIHKCTFHFPTVKSAAVCLWADGTSPVPPAVCCGWGRPELSLVWVCGGRKFRGLSTANPKNKLGPVVFLFFFSSAEKQKNITKQNESHRVVNKPGCSAAFQGSWRGKSSDVATTRESLTGAIRAWCQRKSAMRQLYHEGLCRHSQ